MSRAGAQPTEDLDGLGELAYGVLQSEDFGAGRGVNVNSTDLFVFTTIKGLSASRINKPTGLRLIRL